MADVTRYRLEQIADRLVLLLKKEPDPQETMDALAERLMEEGLLFSGPAKAERPEAFADRVIRNNPELAEQVAMLPLPNLEAMETAEELVLSLLPTSSLE